MLLVVDNSVTARNRNQNGTLLGMRSSSVASVGYENCPSDSWNWICDSTESCPDIPCSKRLPGIQSDVSNWEVLGYKVKYCVAQTMEEHCKLQFSIYIAALVIFLNLLKASIMLWLAFGVKESPLMTMGDAVASFIQQPDPNTKNMCLASNEHIKRVRKNWNALATQRQYNQQRRRWFAAASKTRWTICIVM